MACIAFRADSGFLSCTVFRCVFVSSQGCTNAVSILAFYRPHCSYFRERLADIFLCGGCLLAARLMGKVQVEEGRRGLGQRGGGDLRHK